MYPRITGRRPLKTPGLIQALFPPDEIRPAAVVMQAMPEPLLQQEQQQGGAGVGAAAAAAAAAGEDVGPEAQPQAAAVAAGGAGRPHED